MEEVQHAMVRLVLRKPAPVPPTAAAGGRGRR